MDEILIFKKIVWCQKQIDRVNQFKKIYRTYFKSCSWLLKYFFVLNNSPEKY